MTLWRTSYQLYLPKYLDMSESSLEDSTTNCISTIEISTQNKNLLLRKCFWKCLQNGGHFVQALMCWKNMYLLFVVLVFQDEANKAGGKWIVRLKKGLASRCWENLILAMLGEQFMVGEEICGAVISVRYQVGTKDGGCVIVTVLGESDTGHVRGTVHGRGGDLWGSHICEISGRYKGWRLCNSHGAGRIWYWPC